MTMRENRGGPLPMPVIRFICPHCEKPAEVQVTAVARSRPCPLCAQPVVLQVASRGAGDGVIKRRALLVNPAPTKIPDVVPAPPVEIPAKEQLAVVVPSPALPVMNGPVYESKGFVGDVLEQLRYDPEVVETRRRLTHGVMAVAVCIVLALVWDRVSPWSPQNAPKETVAPVSQKIQPSSPIKKETNAIGMIPRSADEKAEATGPPTAIQFQGAANQEPAAEPDRQVQPIRIVVPAQNATR